MRTRFSVRLPRIAGGFGLLVAGIALFVAQTGVAYAHHVDLSASSTCYDFRIEADYIGGDGARYAEVRVNGTLVHTANFPAGTADALDFFVLEAPLPTNTTVDVRMFRLTNGSPVQEDYDSITVNKALSCTSTPTETAAASLTPTATAASTTTTATPAPSETPVAATETPAPTETPIKISTSTPESPATVQATETATETAIPTRTTEAPTNTPLPTDTPSGEVVEETPTYVSTVEALLPQQPEGPGTNDSPGGETASGLPSTGNGPRGVESLGGAIAALVMSALGLAVMATGVRRRNAV